MRTLVLLFAIACGGPVPAVEVPDREVEQADPDWRPRLDDQAAWDALASRPANHHVAHVEVVKVVVDLRDGERVYFLRSDRYESHFDFVQAFLDRTGYRDGMDFYAREYRSPDRRFVLASLVRWVDGGQWTFELVSGDDLSAERIVWLREHLGRFAFFGPQLRFRPISDLHLARVAEAGDRLPIADDGELFGALTYQPVQLGAAFGTLHVVRGAVPRGRLGPRDLIVTDEVPDDLPLVAGLITSRFQAPLAHVAVLSRNRRTPDMALRGAVDDPRLTALEGRLVRLEVGAQEFTIAPATMEQAQAAWEASRPRETFSPLLDLDVRDLRDQCSLRLPDVRFAGAKASNMGELCALGQTEQGRGIEVPPGFVIPFARYTEHLRRGRIDARVQSFLQGSDRGGDPTAALEALRQAIASAPIDPALVREVRDRIRALGGTRVHLRSSTNAEDLPGFNGAGLYLSDVIATSASDSEIADSVRRVWASVWNLGAFQEREHYRIDHARVMMAVLVQRTVTGAIGNGVAISANPYDAVRPGILINVQTQGGSVTGARGDEIPEQWLTLTYLEPRVPELLARSSLANGQAILRGSEVLELVRQIEVIHRRFVPDPNNRTDAVDVEFLFTGDGHRPILVQSRPYRVTYEGR
ncbi:MAG: hypothetical protein IT378_20680 [Sandaracinaceae bacterium]|nr:hypothetical protein [Sandaracinaceae bacterium]